MFHCVVSVFSIIHYSFQNLRKDDSKGASFTQIPSNSLSSRESNPLLFSLVDFRKKVHMIPEPQLSQFLMPGFESYLPDDMATGKAPTDDMVADYIRFRKYVEE